MKALIPLLLVAFAASTAITVACSDNAGDPIDEPLGPVKSPWLRTALLGQTVCSGLETDSDEEGRPTCRPTSSWSDAQEEGFLNRTLADEFSGDATDIPATVISWETEILEKYLGYDLSTKDAEQCVLPGVLALDDVDSDETQVYDSAVSVAAAIAEQTALAFEASLAAGDEELGAELSVGLQSELSAKLSDQITNTGYVMFVRLELKSRLTNLRRNAIYARCKQLTSTGINGLVVQVNKALRNIELNINTKDVFELAVKAHGSILPDVQARMSLNFQHSYSKTIKDTIKLDSANVGIYFFPYWTRAEDFTRPSGDPTGIARCDVDSIGHYGTDELGQGLCEGSVDERGFPIHPPDGFDIRIGEVGATMYWEVYSEPGTPAPFQVSCQCETLPDD